MSATKEFRVGDTVKMSDIGKKQYQDAKYNPYDLTGVITKVNSIIVKWSNGETNSYDPRHIELVEPKQEQYYTSIPTDVKVGDKFKLVYTKSIGTTSEDMDIKWCSDRGFNIGDIVFLKHNDGSSCPKFENNGKTLYLNWGWLKPVKENVVTTAHLADIPPKTLIGRTTESTDVQQFNIGDKVKLLNVPAGSSNKCLIGQEGIVIDTRHYGFHVQFTGQTYWCKPEQLQLLTSDKIGMFSIGDEVELIEDFNFAKRGTKGVIRSVNTEDRSAHVDFKNYGKNTYIHTKRLKLVNNNKIEQHGKVHSTTSYDLRTAFSPDIRSKEICAGQVFSQFNLPKIWSGH